MDIIRDADLLRDTVRNARSAGKKIGFVPTMGALHRGHLSLIEIAKKYSDITVVSIFVNPTQFGPGEDYERYPRQPEEDCKLLEQAGVEIAYIPSRSQMYPDGYQITVDPGPLGFEFEGRVRPSHFRGVLTIVAKLFAQIQPDVAVFGQKDAQQLHLVKRMVKDLDFQVEIIKGLTIRETDGLALSSRNAYLKRIERKQANVLHLALDAGLTSFQNGERSLRKIQETMQNILYQLVEFQTDYCTVVDDESFFESDPVSERPRFIVAGKLGSVRLIDNKAPHDS